MQRRRQWHYRLINNPTMMTMALIRSRRRLYHGRRIITLRKDATRGGWRGGIYIIEGGPYIFNDIPNIWARWPTNDGIIIIRGRALIVVVVALLFGGGFDDVLWMQSLLAVVD